MINRKIIQTYYDNFDKFSTWARLTIILHNYLIILDSAVVYEFEYISTINAMKMNYEFAVAKLDGRAQLHKVYQILILILFISWEVPLISFLFLPILIPSNPFFKEISFSLNPFKEMKPFYCSFISSVIVKEHNRIFTFWWI